MSEVHWGTLTDFTFLSSLFFWAHIRGGERGWVREIMQSNCKVNNIITNHWIYLSPLVVKWSDWKVVNYFVWWRGRKGRGRRRVKKIGASVVFNRCKLCRSRGFRRQRRQSIPPPPNHQNWIVARKSGGGGARQGWWPAGNGEVERGRGEGERPVTSGWDLMDWLWCGQIGNGDSWTREGCDDG